MSRFNNLRAHFTSPSPLENRPELPVPRRQPVSPASALKPAAVPRVNPDWVADENNAIRKLGFWFALGFIFIRLSMIHEILTFGIGINLYLPYVLGVPAILLVLASGGVVRTFRSTPSILLAGFMVWLLLIAPFSVWRGGTFELLSDSFKTEFSMLFMVAGLVMTWRELQLVASCLALCTAINVLAAVKYGITSEGRYSLSFGTLQNPNDMATHMLLVAPFALLVLLNLRGLSIKRIACVGALMGTLIIVVKSGSRSAIVTIVVMLIMVFFKARGGQRLLIASSTMLACILTVAVAPDIVFKRFRSIVEFTPDMMESEEMMGAIGSSEARMNLLKYSLIATLKHPITGVGPGQFAIYEADVAKDAGRRGAWHATHNSYTEVSSEAGVPAFLFFAGSILSSLFLLNRIHRRAFRNPAFLPIRNFAFCLMLSLTGFASSIFFASLAYRYYLSVLVGLTVSFAVFAHTHMNAQKQPPVKQTA